MTLWGGLSSGFKNLQDLAQETQTKLQGSIAAQLNNDEFPVPEMRRANGSIGSNSQGYTGKAEDDEDKALNAYIRTQYQAQNRSRAGSAGSNISGGSIPSGSSNATPATASFPSVSSTGNGLPSSANMPVDVTGGRAVANSNMHLQAGTNRAGSVLPPTPQQTNLELFPPPPAPPPPLPAPGGGGTTPGTVGAVNRLTGLPVLPAGSAEMTAGSASSTSTSIDGPKKSPARELFGARPGQQQRKPPSSMPSLLATMSVASPIDTRTAITTTAQSGIMTQPLPPPPAAGGSSTSSAVPFTPQFEGDAAVKKTTSMTPSLASAQSYTTPTHDGIPETSCPPKQRESVTIPPSAATSSSSQSPGPGVAMASSAVPAASSMGVISVPTSTTTSSIGLGGPPPIGVDLTPSLSDNMNVLHQISGVPGSTIVTPSSIPPAPPLGTSAPAEAPQQSATSSTTIPMVSSADLEGEGFSLPSLLGAAGGDASAAMNLMFLQQQLRETQKQIRVKDQRIQQLEQQNQLFQEQLQQTSQLQAQLQARFRETEGQLRQAKEQATQQETAAAAAGASSGAQDAQKSRQEADELKLALEAFRTQVEEERKETQKQLRGYETSNQQLQNRLDRQQQKMRDLETNYAQASAPLQKRVAELEATAKGNTYDLQRTIDELNTDVTFEREKTEAMAKEMQHWRQQLSESHALVAEREEEVRSLKNSDRLEIQTLKRALAQLQKQVAAAAEQNTTTISTSSKQSSVEAEAHPHEQAILEKNGGEQRTELAVLEGEGLAAQQPQEASGSSSTATGSTSTPDQANRPEGAIDEATTPAALGLGAVENDQLTTTKYNSVSMDNVVNDNDNLEVDLSPSDAQCIRRQNAHLKSELQRLRDELMRRRTATPARSSADHPTGASKNGDFAPPARGDTRNAEKSAGAGDFQIASNSNSTTTATMHSSKDVQHSSTRSNSKEQRVLGTPAPNRSKNTPLQLPLGDASTPGSGSVLGTTSEQLLAPAERETALVDSWFQQDAINLTVENDRLRADYQGLQSRFEKALQVIGRLQEEIEKTKR
ncbi:unnamed protein product [Amoebophrya sp. A25]|nr:unnamed protein product [Amoebophrya sp. A25]|eukprot:GSA25T00020116001.1